MDDAALAGREAAVNAVCGANGAARAGVDVCRAGGAAGSARWLSGGVGKPVRDGSSVAIIL
jgi:hypothetical protein